MMEYIAGQGDAGTRLDVFVASQYPQFTRSSLELLFEKDLIQINGRPAKAAYRVRPEDKVTIDESYLMQEPPAIKLPILYEDDNVTVIDKPEGVLTHSKGALNLEPTVASFIKSKLNDESLSGNRAGIVHRLDRATSGVIITAKNAAALKHLQKQFSQRKTKKKYIAVVEGVPQPPQAIIDAPIGRNPRKPQTFMVSAAGKSATTKYTVIEELSAEGRQQSVVELEPLSGRTHQLRVHLAYIGHPIVGDRIYGKGGDKLLLHATSLEVTLPGGERQTFSSKTPARLKDAIREGK